MQRPSRASRHSVNTTPVATLEHDAIAVALQEALGVRVVLIRAIGEGGMGRVYLGRDPQLKRFVAVKVLLQSGADVEAHARFQREAQAIAAVSHPNVVAIYGVGELPSGTPYFVMQHIGGGSMAERLAATGPLPIEFAESVLGDVAAALAAAHKRGIVHRDVKPANVLWDEEGERATVSDFGIASLQEGEGDESDLRITATGMTVGSPAYMSPEQLLTEEITPKSDIYALGLLGYELLTARGPYDATTPHGLVAAHLKEMPRKLSDLRPDVPPVLEGILLRCLAKNAADRPAADEVMSALTPGAADALEWPPPGLERARSALWRMMTMPALGTVFLLLPLLLLVKLGRAGIIEDTAVWPLILAAFSLLGFAAFVRGGMRAWRTAGSIADAARLGYGWGTLAEVISDRRGDTGSLIAGTREYAMLSSAERTWLRVLRVVQATLLFLAAPVALLTAIIALTTFGSETAGESRFVAWSFDALLLFGALGVIAGLYEQFRLAAIRRRRAEVRHRTNERELAPAWYTSFERSRAGQGFGPGHPVQRIGAALVAAIVTGVVLFCAAVILMASVLTMTGQIISGVITPSASNYLVQLAQRNAGGGSYRTPPDGHTTPIEAGEALLDVASTSRRRPPSPIEHTLSADYPHWSRVVPPAGLFEKKGDMLWTTAAILTAANGLDSAQRDLLQRAAAHPARDAFSLAARASQADVFGALLKLPLAHKLHPTEYPTASLFGVNEAAESHAASAALAVADHHPQDAERYARDIIAVGDLLLDVPFTDNIEEGFRTLNRGVASLEAVFIASGREREARILLDSVAVVASRANRMYLLPSGQSLQRAIHNARYPRGVRMGMVMPLVYRTCSDPRQLLFGVDDTFSRTLSFARDSLARFPSERVWVDAMSDMMTSDVDPPESQGRSTLLSWMAAIMDHVVGGRRFENCAILTPVLGLRF